MARYRVNVGEFSKVCDFFYRLVSQQVEERYQEWKNEEKPRRASMVDIHGSRKILGAVINYHKKLPSEWDYPAFIPYGLDSALVDKGLFVNLQELYWGDEPVQYFKEFFTVLTMAVVKNGKYERRLLPNFPKNEESILDFYSSHPDIIVGQNSLLERFTKFTENQIETVRWIRKSESDGKLMSKKTYSEMVNDEDKKLEKTDKVLTFGTFEHFSEAIKIFVDKSFLPFMNEQLLPEMIDEQVAGDEDS